MKFCRLLLTISVFFTIIFSAKAQQGTLSIQGNIQDSATGKAVGYVTVELRSATAAQVKGTVTSEQGAFLLDRLLPGQYTLLVTAIGYNRKMVTVELSANNSQAGALGNILLSAQSTQLNKVDVVASRPLITREADRLIFDVQADAASKVETALQMMRRVPLLTVDAEDNIELKGSTNYRVFINGKPLRFQGSPKDLLRSIPASNIQKIEVITTPPAKYESEGLAGIINIITTKKIGDGYNGNINISERFPAGGPNAGASITYKTGKFGISATGGAGYNRTPDTRGTGTRDTYGDDPTSFIYHSIKNSEQTSGYLDTELSFEIDSLNLLAAGFSFNKNHMKSNSRQESLMTDAMDTVLQQYDLAGPGKNDMLTYSIDVNYQLGFKKHKDRLLTFSYNYNQGTNDQFNALSFANRKNYPTPDYQQTNNGKTTEQTYQVDFALPINKGFSIETGVKAILRHNNSDFQYRSRNQNTGEFEVDTAFTNAYSNKQDVLGAYISGQYNLKEWSVKAGVRAERTIIDADFVDAKVKQDYNNVLPSISVSRNLKNAQSLSFGFAQRLQRPNIWSLNPFVDRSNPNFVTSGNPDLRPVLSNNIELNYSLSKKGAVNVGLTYSFSDRAVQMVTSYNKETNVTFRTFKNIGKERSIGSNFSVNYPLTTRWRVNMNGLLNYIWIEGVVDSVLQSNSGLRGSFSVGTDYRFNKGWRANAQVQYLSPRVTLQGKTNAFVYLSLGGSKSFFNDKLTASAIINNPFTKFFYYVGYTKGPDFYQTGDFQFYWRSFSVSLNYRFGKLKEKIRKNKRGISNEDELDVRSIGR